jgi:hypothetical protein
MTVKAHDDENCTDDGDNGHANAVFMHRFLSVCTQIKNHGYVKPKPCMVKLYANGKLQIPEICG